MSEITTRPRRREQTRARLLDAAHEVFAEVGMDAASVEMICERAGFTRGAFYSNFESKEELFLDLITHLADQKMDEVAGRVRRLSGDALADPSTMVRGILGVSLGNDIEPRLISEMRSQAMRDTRLAAAYLAWQDVIRARVEQIVAEVVRTYGLSLRLPQAETAQLLLDVSDDTCARAALEGCTAAEVSARLNERLERLVAVLVYRDED